MNWVEIEENWVGMQNVIRSYWSKLSSDDVNTVNRRREHLSKILQDRYGLTPDNAEIEIRRFEYSVRRPGAAC